MSALVRCDLYTLLDEGVHLYNHGGAQNTMSNLRVEPFFKSNLNLKLNLLLPRTRL